MTDLIGKFKNNKKISLEASTQCNVLIMKENIDNLLFITSKLIALIQPQKKKQYVFYIEVIK